MGLRRLIHKLILRYGSQARITRVLRQIGMRVGERCRFYSVRLPSEPWLVRLGDDVTVSVDVTFITHGATTIFRHKYDSLTGFGKIDIRANSYVGANVTILPNITIGPNSVVGAGSVVTKDVPPNTVVAGNPARPISSIDEYEQRCLARHIDIPLDREAARRVLEKHFWGEDA